MTISRWRLAAVFVATLLAQSYFTGESSWNQYSHLAPALTFVEPGPSHLTFRIDDFEHRVLRGVETHDWAFGVDGYLYANKAPGLSMLAVPAYALLYAIETWRGVDVTGRPWTYWNASVINIWASALSTAAATTMFVAFLCAGGWTPRETIVPVVAYTLGSLVMPFGTSLFGHATSAACVLMSFCLAFWPGGTRHAALAGMFGGLAVLIEYPAVFALAAIGLAMIFRPSTRRQALTFAAGAALPLLVLVGYQKVVFGGFLTPTVARGNPAFLTQGQALGVVGGVKPFLVGVLLFSRYRGLFVYCPVLTFAAVGAWRLWWRGERILVAACLGAVVAAVLFVSSFNGWWGGFCTGPRYLIVIIPLLVVLLPSLTQLSSRWRWLYLVSLVLSVVNMVSIAAVDVMVDPSEQNPVYGFTYGLLFSGKYPKSRLSWNFGAHVLGLHPPFDLVPFVIVAGAIVAALWLIPAGATSRRSSGRAKS